jgi:5-methylcytosine-specific restriction endonuclease McrA
LAETIRQRDGYRCQRCNKTQDENGQKLSVDHIIAWRTFDDKTEANRPRNLVSLCRSCHSLKTSTFEQASMRGDCIAMYQYERNIVLPSAVRDVK